MNHRPNCQYYGEWKASTQAWCEERICALVKEPSNTYSNAAYLIVGIYLVSLCRKVPLGHLHLLGFFCILIGLMSGFYHASGSFVGEVFDYSSMYLLSIYFLSMNLRRLYDLESRTLWILALFLLCLSIGSLVTWEVIGSLLFGTQVILALTIEVYLSKIKKVRVKYRALLQGCALFILAYVFWNLDRYRIVCDPNNHILNGHALWHIITAVAIFYIYKFYSQFEFKNE